MSRHALALFLIFVGGGIGTIARHIVNVVCAAAFGINFGWGTLLVNIFGSFMMGVLAGWFALKADGGQLLPLFVTTGILGGFTTFSAFSLDAVLLLQRGHAASATMYVVGSVVGAMLGLLAGLTLIKSFAVR